MKTLFIVLPMLFLAGMTMNCLGETIKTTIRMIKSTRNRLRSYEDAVNYAIMNWYDQRFTNIRSKYNSPDEIVLEVDVDVSEYYQENPSRTLNEIAWLLSSHINKNNPDCEATIQLDGENKMCAIPKTPGLTYTNQLLLATPDTEDICDKIEQYFHPRHRLPITACCSHTSRQSRNMAGSFQQLRIIFQGNVGYDPKTQLGYLRNLVDILNEDHDEYYCNAYWIE
ncbi:hypothetical protein EG68_07199 [Paragonimus skrjabini miyazakii]|uniref:Uncharacterized protein n=1 Tax=Paragonimus skrjabini miyazakii TaxID=59628 RepID=A0A8S9YMB0_9TREM|nr:hypothetical protein EG68_07199 [Paragonimus skrjabini miyazakii]